MIIHGRSLLWREARLPSCCLHSDFLSERLYDADETQEFPLQEFPLRVKSEVEDRPALVRSPPNSGRSADAS
jgi:hypothetical protein